MKIVSVSPKSPRVLVKSLTPGTLYRIEARTHTQVELEGRTFMVVKFSSRNPHNNGQPYSIELSNGRVVPWNGHEELTAVVLEGTLEVSDK